LLEWFRRLHATHEPLLGDVGKCVAKVLVARSPGKAPAEVRLGLGAATDGLQRLG